MSQTKSFPEIIAYHESGHAIANYIFGFRIHEMGIKQGEVNGWKYSGYIETPSYQPNPYYDYLFSFWGHLVKSLAGTLICYKKHHHMDGYIKDFSNPIGYIRYYLPKSMWLEWGAYTMMGAVLLAYSPKVQHAAQQLAELLLIKNKLKGQDISQTLSEIIYSENISGFNDPVNIFNQLYYDVWGKKQNQSTYPDNFDSNDDEDEDDCIDDLNDDKPALNSFDIRVGEHWHQNRAFAKSLYSMFDILPSNFHQEMDTLFPLFLRIQAWTEPFRFEGSGVAEINVSITSCRKLAKEFLIRGCNGADTDAITIIENGFKH